MTTIDNEIKQLSNKYYCEKCDYGTCRKNNMNTHLASAKHQKTTTYNINSAENNDTSAILSKYCCPVCDKKYNERAGLWRHKKKCIKEPNKTINISDEPHESDDDDAKSKKAVYSMDPQMLLDVLKQNQEFQMFMMEQHKQMMEMAKSFNTNTINNTNCNNTNTNTFNLQLFLNEKCKDALNMNEFVDTIKMQLSDLENFAHVGYADGVSKICVKNLNNLATFLRPIHCSDVKRETLYIKHNDEWIKEGEDKALLRDAIKKIANKNIRQINEWIKENPNCTDPRSKNNDKYLKIVMNAMSGTTVEEQQENMDKIVKNVTKAVAIDKYAVRS